MDIPICAAKLRLIREMTKRICVFLIKGYSFLILQRIIENISAIF